MNENYRRMLLPDSKLFRRAERLHILMRIAERMLFFSGIRKVISLMNLSDIAESVFVVWWYRFFENGECCQKMVELSTTTRCYSMVPSGGRAMRYPSFFPSDIVEQGISISL